MELVLFIGLQASGKSSFYRARFTATHAHVSMDHFPNNRNRRARQLLLVEEALRGGRSVVIDNTNPTALDRAPIIHLARSRDVPVIGYYFESRLGPCVERNRARLGKARVPDVALFATVKRLERPSLDEGFSRLYHVRMSESGDWEVSEWCDSVDELSAPTEEHPA
jgi:predicted kinase